MSSFYVIGSAEGPCWVGSGAQPEKAMEKALADRAPLRLVRCWESLTPDLARLLERSTIARLVKLGKRRCETGWIMAGADEARDAAEVVFEAYVSTDFEPPAMAMRRLRETVFQCSQATIADITKVSTSVVSRWESGEASPDYRAIARLWCFADLAGLPWPRDLFVFGASVAIKPPAPLQVIQGGLQDENP